MTLVIKRNLYCSSISLTKALLGTECLRATCPCVDKFRWS